MLDLNLEIYKKIAMKTKVLKSAVRAFNRVNTHLDLIGLVNNNGRLNIVRFNESLCVVFDGFDSDWTITETIWVNYDTFKQAVLNIVSDQTHISISESDLIISGEKYSHVVQIESVDLDVPEQIKNFSKPSYNEDIAIKFPQICNIASLGDRMFFTNAHGVIDVFSASDIIIGLSQLGSSTQIFDVRHIDSKNPYKISQIFRKNINVDFQDDGVVFYDKNFYAFVSYSSSVKPEVNVCRDILLDSSEFAFTVDRDALSAVLSSIKGRSKLIHYITLHITSSTLKIGNAVVRVESDFSIDRVLTLNLEYFLKIINQCSEGKVLIGISDESRIVRIRSTNSIFAIAEVVHNG
jgi:hypothetical protein